MSLRVHMCVLHILCLRVSWVCLVVSEYLRLCMFVFTAHCSLKAEASSILRNRELAEYRQTSTVNFINATAGFRATERTSRAASILVLV